MPVSRRERLPINPAVLRWAREWSGCDINTAATRAGVNSDRLVEWERDDATTSPTVRQARILADLYERPFLEFFQPHVPELKRPDLIPDFRLYRDAVSPRQRIEFEKLQAWAETQRVNALDLLAEIGEEPPLFPRGLYSTVESDVEDAATAARDALAFSVAEQFAIRSDSREQIPNIIREKIERVGVLTLREAGLRELHARGFCIAKFPLPLIVFGGESPRAQAYTLMHEFGHLILQQSAISGAITRIGGAPNVRATEKWCNRFAAAFLMPQEAVFQFVRPGPTRLPSIPDELIRSIANRFSVSDHAALVRLVELRIVDDEFYWSVKRPQYDALEADYRPGGRSRYYGTRYKNRLGRLYTNLVMQAWESGRITNHNAAEFMGIKNLSHLYDIKAEVMP